MSPPGQLQAGLKLPPPGTREYFAAIARQPRRPRATKAKLQAATRALQALGQSDRALNHRTRLARSARAFRGGVVDALGGRDNCTPQQLTLVELATTQRLLLELVDRDLMALDSLVNRGRRALWPIVVQRQTLADGLLRSLQALGLERKARALPSALEYSRQLAARTAAEDAPE